MKSISNFSFGLFSSSIICGIILYLNIQIPNSILINFYYQPKHSTVSVQNAMKPAEIKQTIEGFADRFHQRERGKCKELVSISFSDITNMKIDDTVKNQLICMAKGETVQSRFDKTNEIYTKLEGKQLGVFCALRKIHDGEGDYNVQNTELHVELAQLRAGSVTSTHTGPQRLLPRRVPFRKLA